MKRRLHQREIPHTRRRQPESGGADGLRHFVSIDEAAILLGISDNIACQLEHSALDKLRRWAKAARIDPRQGLGEVTDAAMAQAWSAVGMASPALAADPYSPLRNWWPLSGVMAVNQPCAAPAELSISFMLLRRSLGSVAKAPLIDPHRGGVDRIPLVESIVRHRDMLLFRATSLPARCKSGDGDAAAKAYAVIEYLNDRDENGDFAVPMLLAVILGFAG